MRSIAIFSLLGKVVDNFDKSLKNRLIILMIICTSIPMIIVISISFNNSTKAMEKEIVQSNVNEIIWSGKYADDIIQQHDDALFSFMADSTLVSDMEAYNSGASVSFENQKYISDKIFSLFYSKRQLEGISLLIRNKMLYFRSETNMLILDHDSTKDQLWGYDQKNQKSVLLNRKYPRIITDNNVVDTYEGYVNGVSLVRSMRDFETKKIICDIVFDIRWEALDSVLDMLASDNAGMLFIIDKNGKIAYNPYKNNTGVLESDSTLERIVSDKENERNYGKLDSNYFFYQWDRTGSFCIVKTIPYSAIGSSSRQTLGFSILAGIIFIFVSILISTIVAFTITRPVISLAKSMKEVGANKFELNINKFHKDEIGILERSFVQMIGQIKELINTEYKSKIEKRTAQLKALQAQVNPHFLYNSLMLVGGMAVSKGVPEILTVTKALSDIFRYTIKTQDDMVKIEQEVLHVKNYLTIQLLRHQDKLRVELQTDEEIYPYVIPKLCIQPIVENAFVHGLDTKGGPWQITIRGRREEDFVIFEIIDNGVGIEAEKMEEIRRNLEQDEIFNFTKSLGFKNVDSRLKLSFGMEYGLHIESRRSEGTKVTIRIPVTLPEAE